MFAAALMMLLLPAAKPVDTVVVCPPAFRAALAPWVEYRQAEGHSVAYAATHADAEAIRRDIRRIAAFEPVRSVLLVGDAEPPRTVQLAAVRPTVPTHHSVARVNVRFGSEPEIAGDNWYADLDDDRVPDVAIGRLTADSPAELAGVVSKILAYERSTDFGPWRRHLQFVAGVGGFGSLADGAIELAAKNVITAGVPAAYSTTMTYASPRSPFYPAADRFQEAALAGLNDGCLFWVYLGHGQPRGLDRVRSPDGRWLPILEMDDARRLRAQRGPAVACLFACYAGAFDAPDDCLGEELLRSPGGPVAVVCGSRVTMPYAMTVLGTELLEQCFVVRQPTLGAAVLAAKRAALKSDSPSPRRAMLDAVASLLSPGPVDLAGEREEHAELFNLLGDPLLSLKQPGEIKLTAPAKAKPGETIKLSGTAPQTGDVLVELVVRRDRLRHDPPPRPSAGSGKSWTSEELADNYRKANDACWTSVKVAVQENQAFTAELTIPAEAQGPCHVRAFMNSAKGHAAGAADIEIEAQPGN
jgi:Peptidase family C25